MNFFNKIIVFFSCVALALLIIDCNSSKLMSKNLKSVTGEIEVVGNEPFTHLALKEDSTKVYILDCNNKAKNVLMQNQGKISRIFYTSLDSSKIPPVMKVDSVKIISKKFQ